MEKSPILILFKGRYFQRLSVLIIACLCFYSCKEQEFPDPSPKDEPIRLENGYLHFENEEAFDAMISKTKELSYEELLTWESQYGFTSMRSFYEKALRHESELHDYLMKHPEELEGIQELPFSQFVQSNLEYFHVDEKGSIRINSFRSEVASVLNKQGVVRVGDILYQYSFNQLKQKFILDHEKINANTIQDFLSASETNEERQIYVSPVQYRILTESELRTDYDGACSSEADNIRVDGEVRLSSTTYASLQWVWNPITGTFEQKFVVEYHSTFEVYAKRSRYWTFIYFNFSGDLEIQGTYRQNGQSKSFYFGASDVNSMTRTVYSGIYDESQDITNSSTRFEAENNTALFGVTDPYCYIHF